MQEVRRTVFTRRADAASSTMAHGVFSWAARESGDGRSGATGREALGDLAVDTPLNWKFAESRTRPDLNFYFWSRAH